MNARDHNSPWQAAIRKQRRQMWFVIAGSAIVPLVMIGVIGLFAPIAQYFGWIAIIMGVALLPMPFVMLRMSRQHRRFSETVPKHAGIVCPKCIEPLLEVPDGHNQYKCGKCARQYNAHDLRRFWDLSVHDPMAAARQWIESTEATSARERFARRMVQLNKNPLGIVVFNAVLWIGMGMIFGLVRGGSVIAGALTYVHMFLLMTGVLLIVNSRKARLGDSRHCATCEYEQSPDTGAIERCPECGSKWNEIGGLVHGRLARRPHLLIIGAVMMTIGIGAIASPMFLRGWQTRLMPTSSLISQVIKERGFTVDEWKELNTRTISPAQATRLATGLIDKRKGRGRLPTDDDNWLVAQITAGKLPGELRDRYYREMLDLKLIAPDAAKVGQEIKLAVSGTYRGASSMNPSAAVYVGGYLIGNAIEPINRGRTPLGGILLDPKKAGRTVERIEAAIVPDAPGPLRVRLEVWIVALPFSQGPPIQWQPDNSPVIPPTAAWFEKRVLEQVIQVEE